MHHMSNMLHLTCAAFESMHCFHIHVNSSNVPKNSKYVAHISIMYKVQTTFGVFITETAQ